MKCIVLSLIGFIPFFLFTSFSGQITLGLLNETYDSDVFSGYTTGSDLTFNTVADYVENPIYLDS